MSGCGIARVVGFLLCLMLGTAGVLAPPAFADGLFTAVSGAPYDVVQVSASFSEGDPISWSDAGAFCDSASRYYVVRSVSTDCRASADSGGVGTFRFGLLPGGG